VPQLGESYIPEEALISSAGFGPVQAVDYHEHHPPPEPGVTKAPGEGEPYWERKERRANVDKYRRARRSDFILTVFTHGARKGGHMQHT
jgi:hypothetical protein